VIIGDRVEFSVYGNPGLRISLTIEEYLRIAVEAKDLEELRGRIFEMASRAADEEMGGEGNRIREYFERAKAVASDPAEMEIGRSNWYPMLPHWCVREPSASKAEQGRPERPAAASTNAKPKMLKGGMKVVR
jgi:hypothetical protein